MQLTQVRLQKPNEIIYMHVIFKKYKDGLACNITEIIKIAYDFIYGT